MKTVSVSAPGKLLLFGDHAVVYGHPAIVTAVNTRLTVSIKKSDNKGVDIHTPQNDTRFTTAAVEAFSRHTGAAPDGLTMDIHSQFDSRLGLGSSAAVTVATIRALSEVYEQSLTDREIFDVAYAAVRAVQKVGSGFDVAASCYGKTLWYEKTGGIIEPVESEGLPLVIGYTGVKADTVTLVENVAQKRASQKDAVDRIFFAMAKIAVDARQKMEEGDWERVGKLMDFSQEYLRDLGVSSETLEALISAAKKAGAWGAKLSGAGGGDCMIALVGDEMREAVETAIQSVGGQVIHTKPHAPGVRVEADDQNEMFIVVDERDTVLGEAPRRECHSDPSRIHRAVELVITNANGDILLQKRAVTKDTNPGKWSVSVGGHVGKGESYEQAMARETKEELGIDVPVSYVTKHVVRFARESEMEAVFTAQSDGPFFPDAHEVSEVKFFSKRELRFALASGAIELTESAFETLKTLHILV